MKGEKAMASPFEKVNFGIMENAFRARANKWVQPTDFPMPTDADNPQMGSLNPAWANQQALPQDCCGGMGCPECSAPPMGGSQLGIPEGASGVAPFAGDAQAMNAALQQRMLNYDMQTRASQNRAVDDNRQALLAGNKLGF